MSLLYETIINAVSQPLCLLTKSNKHITFVNPAMNKLIDEVADINESANHDTFINDYVRFVDLTWENIAHDSNSYNNKPVLIKLLMKTSDQYFYGHFSHLDNDIMILILTPCLLTHSIIENPFLRNHEDVVDVIENAPLAIHIKHITGEILWLNKFEQELLGYTNDELVGRNIKEVRTFWNFSVRFRTKKINLLFTFALCTVC